MQTLSPYTYFSMQFFVKKKFINIIKTVTHYIRQNLLQMLQT